MTDVLDNVFNTLPTPEVTPEPVTITAQDVVISGGIAIPTPESTSEISHRLPDAVVIREQIGITLGKAQQALDNILRAQSGNFDAESTEAIAKLVDSITKLNSNLIDMSKAEKTFEIKLSDKKAGPDKVVNNNVLVTTTTDLIEKLLSRGE